MPIKNPVAAHPEIIIVWWHFPSISNAILDNIEASEDINYKFLNGKSFKFHYVDRFVFIA